MSRQWIFRGLLAAVLLQVAVLASVYFNSVYPLWTGREIRLKTIPVDPRSLFRGNYAQLNYDISSVSVPQALDIDHPRRGEVIYVKLDQDENGLYVFGGASFTEPETGIYIRGRIQVPVWNDSQAYPVRYGIEAYFAPKEKALELEKQLRDGGTAIVYLADNGKAALKHVVGE